MSDSNYAPGTYVKGDVERVALSSRDAVALAFEGFKPKADAPAAEEQKVEEPSAPADAPVEVAQVSEAPKVEAPKPRAPRNRPDVQED